MQGATGQGLGEVPSGEAGPPRGGYGGISPLYQSFLGSVLVGSLSEWTLIDRAGHEHGVVSFKTTGGAERSFGTRPRAIVPSLLRDNAHFFNGLRQSIAEVGIKVPILVYGINGRLYVRYGASRVHAASELGFKYVPAVLCLWNTENGPAPLPSGFIYTRALHSPQEVLTAFGPPRIVGDFEASHEKIDAHRMEPF